MLTLMNTAFPQIDWEREREFSESIKANAPWRRRSVASHPGTLLMGSSSLIKMLIQCYSSIDLAIAYFNWTHWNAGFLPFFCFCRFDGCFKTSGAFHDWTCWEQGYSGRCYYRPVIVVFYLFLFNIFNWLFLIMCMSTYLQTQVHWYIVLRCPSK